MINNNLHANTINNLFYTTVLGFHYTLLYINSYNAVKFIVTKFIR